MDAPLARLPSFSATKWTASTQAWWQLCDTHVRLPMQGVKNSLNVATAGGVVAYELLRKHRALLSLKPLIGAAHV